MKRHNLSYLAVGFFVLAMLIGLMLMLAEISGRTGPADRYSVTYSNVSGLTKGTPVTFEGYTIGRIAAITPRHQGTVTRYRLDLEIKKGWPIPDDSIARILSSGLLSTINIDISAGESTTPHTPGSTIEGRESVSLFAALDTIAADVSSLTKEGVLPLLDRVNQHIDAIAEPVKADTSEILGLLKSSAGRLDTGMEMLFSNLTNLTRELNASADDLRKVVGSKNRKSISGILNNLEEGAADIRKVAGKKNRDSVAGFLGSMEKSANNFETLSEDLEKSRQRLNRLLENSEGVVTDNRENIRAAVAELKSSLEVVSQHISAISYNLEDTSRNMAEFSRQIRQNPGVLLGSTPQQDRAE